ncbi:MAG: DUF58 domain-containing protein [Treponema sp.]|jgi:uncharacterized protein (DUF58 family)|nr:DUF58 domain-containing protein [Treponema sp.]
MDANELLRSITALPIQARSLAEEMLAGNFRSIFKGQGMEFDEERHYEPGDDIRSIDWNVSARFGTPFVKTFKEERELTILILLDLSPSMFRGGFGRQGLSPYEQALVSTALIAFSAERSGQQTGAFFFDKGVSKVFPPRKGRHHVMALIMAALQYQNEAARLYSSKPDKRGSNIASALAGAQRLLKKRALVVLISDFFSANWEEEMGSLCRKHDLIALRICEPAVLPYPGLVTLEDAETGVRIEAPAGLASFRESWTQWHKERSALWASQCRRNGAAFLELPTTSDAGVILLKFFGRRILSGRRERG